MRIKKKTQSAVGAAPAPAATPASDVDNSEFMQGARPEPQSSYPASIDAFVKGELHCEECGCNIPRPIDGVFIKAVAFGVASFKWECPHCHHAQAYVAPIDGVGGRIEVPMKIEVKPDEVTVCWGEEKFFPDPSDRYSSFVAGSVFVKVTQKQGETLEQAGDRAYAAAKLLGERFRKDKGREFLRMLREIKSGNA